MLSGEPSVLKNSYPNSSKSALSDVFNVLNNTFISEVFCLCAENTTLIAVADCSSVIAFVNYIAEFWSPSGSVEATKSVVGNTSLELSMLLILFPIAINDLLSKSITGDTFEF